MKDGNPEEFVVDPEGAFQALEDDDDLGWCTNCGHEQVIEQDAYEARCEKCGTNHMYGALFIVMFSLRGEDWEEILGLKKKTY
ncbi:MAG TPA: hypothetical protein PLZ86_06275 [bacterium]|nr:hypothetical protein [bacterium]